MKKDINTLENIELLVNSFYIKVQKGELIGHVAKVDWSLHLPRMYEFFETIILGMKGLKGNPMETHFKLNQKFPLKPEHLER